MPEGTSPVPGQPNVPVQPGTVAAPPTGTPPMAGYPHPQQNSVPPAGPYPPMPPGSMPPPAAGYPQQAYPQPGYPQQGYYPQPGYPQQPVYQQPGYPPPQPGYPGMPYPQYAGQPVQGMPGYPPPTGGGPKQATTSQAVTIIVGAFAVIAAVGAAIFFPILPRTSENDEQAPAVVSPAPTAVPTADSADAAVPTKIIYPTYTPIPLPADYGCSADRSGTEGCQTIGESNLKAAGCPSFKTSDCDHTCASHPEYRYPGCGRK